MLWSEDDMEDDALGLEGDTVCTDHTYAYASPTDSTTAADSAHDGNAMETLRQLEIDRLKQHIERLCVRQRLGIQRFAGSDSDIQFFTRFASYDYLMRFWALIEPSLPAMVDVTQAQRDTLTEPSSTPTHSLQPIDEMFMFLNYLALGLKQRDLAHRFGVDKSTVTQIITTWSDFLYAVLGSVTILIPVEEIWLHLPAEFKDYADTTVILDCVELKCQCPSSPLLKSDEFSEYKSHCTLKGLFGFAPHGPVTFVSPLYASSVSNKQIIRKSGILSSLRPGMAVMVDRRFLDDNVLPCKMYRLALLSRTSEKSAREAPATTRLRGHVQHLSQRVKEHKFFDTEIPRQLYGSVHQLYSVACLLANYENGLIAKAWTQEMDNDIRKLIRWAF